MEPTLSITKKILLALLIAATSGSLSAHTSYSENATHYLALAKLQVEPSDKSQAKQNVSPQDAFYVAAAQFALEACMHGVGKTCKQLSDAIKKGLGVKPNKQLAEKWKNTLNPTRVVTPLLYKQTLAWFNSARVKHISLTGLAQGECYKVEWQRTLLEPEPVLICRRTTAQIETLQLPVMPNDMLTPHDVAKAMANPERASEFMSMEDITARRVGRSVNPEWFVVSGLEPRFGCALVASFTQEVAFKNPCHGDEWNSVGLPLANQKNSRQLEKTQPLHIPPYSISEQALILGKLPNEDVIKYQNLLPEPLITDEMSAAEQLLIAVRWQQLPVVESLLKVNSYESMTDDPKRAEILINAISTQYLPIIQLLLQSGFQLNEKIQYGGTANDVVKILNNPAINDFINRTRKQS